MRINDLLVETKRKSSAVKLQSAWEKQQAKSTASRKRGEEYMAKIKQDVADKSKKEQGVAEGDDRTVANIKNYERELAKYKKFNANGAHDVKIKNLEKIIAYLKSKQGVAEGLSDTQKKIEDTILKLEQRLKFAKTPEQWDNIKNRIERLQAGLKRSKQGVAEDWQKVNRHDKTDGLSKKAVSAYRREHPGSKLKTAVTTKPSKLKKGSKSAKRRASFCARMSGMKKHRTGAKTKRDPDSNINKALRRWHCESIEEMQELIMIGEQYISKLKEDGSAGGTSSGSIASVSMPLGGKKKKKGGGVNLLGGPVFKR